MEHSKKLPACDSCKLRRIRCYPVPSPESCSCCIRKDIVCTTTPVARRKVPPQDGRRIEAARAAFGTTGSLSQVTETLRDRRMAKSLNSTEINLMRMELSGELVSHLLNLYSVLPRAHFVTCEGLVTQFERAGRRLGQLDPQTEVLAMSVLALTSRLSGHPFLFGPGPPPPAPRNYVMNPLSLALIEPQQFGERREAACSQLRNAALELAWRNRTITNNDKDAIAACGILEIVENRRSWGSGRAWQAAFVAQIRDSEEMRSELKLHPRSWSIKIMRDTLSCVAGGRAHNFTLQDEMTLAGPPPKPLWKVLENGWSEGSSYESDEPFGDLLRPYTYRVTQLASEGFQWKIRRDNGLIFDDAAFAKHQRDLHELSAYLSFTKSQLSRFMSPEAIASRNLPPEKELFRQVAARMLNFIMQSALGSVSIPVYHDLQQRVQDDVTASLQAPIEPGVASTPQRYRLENHMAEIRSALLRSARAVMNHIRSSTVGVAWITHIEDEPFSFWAEIILHTLPIEDGGREITRAEKLDDLQTVLDVIKVVSWSWPQIHHLPLARDIQMCLSTMRLEPFFSTPIDICPRPFRFGVDIHNVNLVNEPSQSPFSTLSQSPELADFDRFANNPFAENPFSCTGSTHL